MNNWLYSKLTTLLLNIFLFLGSLVSAQDTSVELPALDTAITARDSAKVYFNTAWEYYYENPSNTRKYALELLRLTARHKLPRYKARAIGLLGLYNEAVGKYDEAIGYYQEAIEITLPIDSLRYTLSAHYSNLSIAYHHASNFKDALAYQRKAISIQKEFEDEYHEMMSYNALGNIFQRMDELDSATYYFNKALALATDNPVAQSMINSNLGDVYLKQKQWQKAFDAYNYNYQFLRSYSTTSSFDMMDAHYDFAEYYITINQPQRALPHLDSALESARTLGNTDYEADLLRLYSDYYSQTNNPILALKYFKSYHALSDSLSGQAIQSRIADLKSDFEITRRELEIENLKNTSALKDITISKKREETVYLVVLICLVMILLFVMLVFLRRYHRHSQQLKMTNEIIKQKHQEIEELMQESNHRIKNNLQIVSSLLKMQSRNVDTFKAQMALNEAHNRIKTIAMMHQNLQGSESFRKVPVHEFILQLTENIKTSMLTYDSEVTINTDLDKVEVSTDQSIALGLIVNELITNSIKYGIRGSENIWVSLKVKSSTLQLTVSDTGPGFPPNFDHTNTSSLGFRIVNSLTTKLKGTLSVDSIDGASVQITIPYEQAT